MAVSRPATIADDVVARNQVAIPEPRTAHDNVTWSGNRRNRGAINEPAMPPTAPGTRSRP